MVTYLKMGNMLKNIEAKYEYRDLYNNPLNREEINNLVNEYVELFDVNSNKIIYVEWNNNLGLNGKQVRKRLKTKSDVNIKELNDCEYIYIGHKPIQFVNNEPVFVYGTC